MILTHTFVVGGKGYHTGVSQQGKTWQSQSFKAYPFDIYVSTFLPDFIKEGMTVTVSGTVKKKENGEYTNYNLRLPVVDTVYRPETSEQQAPQTDDPFGGGKPMEIDDSDLPFDLGG